MRAHTIRFAIALTIAALLAAPAIVKASGKGTPPPDGFGQCVASCVHNLSVLGDVGGKACVVFCRLTGGGGGGCGNGGC